MNDVWKQLYQVVQDRKASPQEGSYTCYLFDKGLDKILKKVGEECAETIIAAKNGRQEETVGEIFRPDLPSHRDDGPAEHPSGSCAGGAGPPQSQELGI